MPANASERRADMLATAIKHRIDVVSNGITPKGGRAPFTKQMSAREALAWWTEHRYDPLGLALVQGMQPLQVAQLDAWLAQAQNHPSITQQPVAAGAVPGAEGILNRAMGQERRIQGAPVGPEVA